MKGRVQYPEPPIDEALCEFQFVESEDWNLTIPGRLQQRIGGDYDGKPKNQKLIRAEISATEAPTIRQTEDIARVQLPTVDGTRIVAVGRDVLSIHMLRPYQKPELPLSGWDEFLPRIERALEAYWEVAQPHGVKRVGLRYINRIVIPSDLLEVDDYFVCGTKRPAVLPPKVTSFSSRVEYAYDDDVKLVLTFGSMHGGERPEFLLDLDMISELSQPVGHDEALSIAKDLRDREREAFEAVITEKTRELFANQVGGSRGVG